MSRSHKMGWFRWLLISCGLLLAGFGLICTHDLWVPRSDRVLLERMGIMMKFGPGFLLTGCVIFLWGLLQDSKTGLSKVVFRGGLLMLAIGGFPWIYTWIFTGGRLGNEGAGMLGYLIFIFVGMPGLLLTLVGALLRRRSRGNGGAR